MSSPIPIDQTKSEKSETNDTHEKFEKNIPENICLDYDESGFESILDKLPSPQFDEDMSLATLSSSEIGSNGSPVLPDHKLNGGNIIQDDRNPIIVRKKYSEEISPYIQKVHVRYLKPPQLPPPGPIIVRELQSSPKPVPPPLYIRQRQKPPTTPPPIVLRERPPIPPAIIETQVISKRLPSPPPPARQVIIERDPPLPPKPPNIIIERWLPYPPVPKRQVIYQRAVYTPPKPPRNVIIMYEGNPEIRREFHDMGVLRTDPDEYERHYGPSLLDTAALFEEVMMTAPPNGDAKDSENGIQYHNGANSSPNIPEMPELNEGKIGKSSISNGGNDKTKPKFNFEVEFSSPIIANNNLSQSQQSNEIPDKDEINEFI